MDTTSVVNTATATSSTAPNTTALLVAGAVVLTVAGIVIIPPLLRKYSNKVYKASIKKDNIDIDSLGPEIVRKEDNKTEE